MHKSLVERKKVTFLIYETKRTKKEKSMYISDYFALMGEQSGPGEACRQLPDATRLKVQGRSLKLPAWE